MQANQAEIASIMSRTKDECGIPRTWSADKHFIVDYIEEALCGYPWHKGYRKYYGHGACQCIVGL